MPQPMYYQPDVAEPSRPSAWYLRGDIGVGMDQQVRPSLICKNPPDVEQRFAFEQHSMADTIFFDAGIGYELNNWLRFDVTGEYRDQDARSTAFGRYHIAVPAIGDPIKAI